MSSFDVLRSYLLARAPFSDDELNLLETVFAQRTLRAGEFLQRAGEIPKYVAFVAAGCLRSYVIDAKGKEHISHFAPETWWLADTISLMTATPSAYFIDAIEDSHLLLIDPTTHERMVEQIPAVAAAFRTGVQKHAAAKDQRIMNLMTTSAEERYLDFVRRYPSLVTRVPQWMVASYLNLTPETVSRVRKDLSRRRQDGSSASRRPSSG